METEGLLNELARDVRGDEEFGDRRSYTGGSRKAGEELFDDLTKFGDAYEPMFYQSEMKRFETSSGNNADSIMADKPLETEDVRRKPTERQFSRRTSTFIGGKKRTTLQSLSYKPVANKAEKIRLKRKLCRFLSLFFCTQLGTAIILLYFYLGARSDYLTINWPNKDIQINVNNCRIFLEPFSSQDPTKKDLYLDYRSSIKTISYNIFSNNNYFSYANTDTRFEYNVTHSNDDIKGCNLYLSIPESVTLKSFNLKCTNNCIVIQKLGTISTLRFVVLADNANINIANLALGTLDVQIDKGYFQLNSVQFIPGVYTRSILVGSGDIIVETTQPVSVDFSTACENYCLTAYNTNTVVPVVKSNLAAPLNKYLTQTLLAKNLFLSQWTGRTELCTSIQCPLLSNTNLLFVKNFDGNIYVNVLEYIPSAVSSTASIAQGSNYSISVGIPFSTKLLIQSNKDQTIQNNLPNLIIRFIFGNLDAFSMHGSTWVYSDHPLYAKVKPWWLSFFSLGKMVENTNDIKSYLSPGFCPYRKVLSVAQKHSIARTLGKMLPLGRGTLSYLKNSQDDLIQNPMDPSDGFQRFANFSYFSDEWVEVKPLDGDHDIYRPIYLTNIMGVFILIIISILAAVVITVRLMLTLINLLFASFQNVREKLYHIEFYWKIHGRVSNSSRKDAGLRFSVEDDEGEKMQSNALKNFNIKLARSYFDLPSTTAFIDYLIMALWTTGETSMNRFYDIAFEATSFNKSNDLDMQNLQQERVKLKDLKSYYQQMCFLMNYKEHELSSPESIAILNQKGMVLTSSDSNSLYLIRLTLNTTSDLSLSFLKNDKKQTSLQLFLDRFCEQTNFDEDKIPYDNFTERYELFCKLNHLEPMMIDHIILKKKFGIESRTILREIVERDFSHLDNREDLQVKNLLQRMMFYLNRLTCKKQFYSLKVEQLKNVNLYLAGRLNESDVGQAEYTKIVSLAVLEKYWWLKDFLSVMLELSVNITLSVPFVSIFIFQEIEHSSYSLRDESLNIYGFNTYTPDIWLVPQKVAYFDSGNEECATSNSFGYVFVLLGELHDQHDSKHSET